VGKFDFITNDTHSQLYSWRTKYDLVSSFVSTVTGLSKGHPLLLEAALNLGTMTAPTPVQARPQS
jgi:hypothetical protein